MSLLQALKKQTLGGADCEEYVQVPFVARPDIGEEGGFLKTGHWGKQETFLKHHSNVERFSCEAPPFGFRIFLINGHPVPVCEVGG